MNASDKDDNDDDLLVLLSAALKVFDDGSTMMKARYMKKMALVAMSREPGAMRSEVAASCSVVIASIHETGKLRAVSLLDYQKLLL